MAIKIFIEKTGRKISELVGGWLRDLLRFKLGGGRIQS